MNRPTATAPAYRFLADDYPQLERGPVPVEPNVSPEYFERERERIFKRCWLQVCRIEDIPRPGDYLVFDVPVWRTSVLLVHGMDGEVRAFHNACRHRGNKVVARDGYGHGKHYACGFHGWTYDTRGALVDVPDAQQFFGLDPACIGLKPIAAGVWEGFVFLNYQAQPEWSLTEYLGPLATRFAGYPFGEMHQIGSMSAQVRANWKVVVDAFQEAFHVSFVHRNTVCDAFTSKTNPYSHIAWVQLERMHRSASVYGVPELERDIHPAESLAFVYGTAFTQGAHAEAANLPGVNPAGIKDWAFDINVVFPTFFLDPSNHFYFTIQYWPSSVNQTRLDFRFYMPRAQDAGQLISQAYTNSIMRDAGLEDLGTIEDTQRMLESGALEHMILGDQEIALLHNYAVVDRMVRGEL